MQKGQGRAHEDFETVFRIVCPAGHCGLRNLNPTAKNGEPCWLSVFCHDEHRRAGMYPRPTDTVHILNIHRRDRPGGRSLHHDH